MQTIEERAADLRKCNYSYAEALAHAKYEMNIASCAPELLKVLIEIDLQWSKTGGVNGETIAVARK